MERRNSMRYPGYDYSEPGAYFITLCVQSNRYLFGTVENHKVHLSDGGTMIHSTLLELPDVIPSLVVDSFVVMPNHLHALIIIGVDPEYQDQPTRLGNVVGQFKALTTTRYIAGVKERAWPRFDNRLWQRNYYDHIVRSDRGVEKVREYIEGNPTRWQARMDSVRIDEHQLVGAALCGCPVCAKRAQL